MDEPADDPPKGLDPAVGRFGDPKRPPVPLACWDPPNRPPVPPPAPWNILPVCIPPALGPPTLAVDALLLSMPYFFSRFAISCSSCPRYFSMIVGISDSLLGLYCA
jgi:hypothetical protein